MTRDTLVNQRPFYMSRLAVDPSNPDRVFFASEDLIETRDGGKTLRRRRDGRASRPSRPVDLARRTAHHRGRRRRRADLDRRRQDLGLALQRGDRADLPRSATTSRIRIASAAGFKTTTRTAARRTRSARSASRTPTGATSATTATARGCGRSPAIRRRSGTSASTSSTASSASTTCARAKTTTSRPT